MDIKTRLSAAKLIERMNSMENFAEELGLSDCSTFHGVPIKHEESIRDASAADEKQMSDR